MFRSLPPEQQETDRGSCELVSDVKHTYVRDAAVGDDRFKPVFSYLQSMQLLFDLYIINHSVQNCRWGCRLHPQEVEVELLL